MAKYNDRDIMLVGLKGDKGDKGDAGAKIISTEFVGTDADGGYVYRQTFDDGSTTEFTVPKSEGLTLADLNEKAEEWTFTLEDGSTVTKKVVIL